MGRKLNTAALTATQKRNPRRDESEPKAARRPDARLEPTVVIAFKLAVSVDDQIEDTLVQINRAARASGGRQLKKRELIELALRNLLLLSPGEILDSANQS